jgi:hypothetical protein
MFHVQVWYAEFLLEIDLKFLLRNTGERLNFKIAVISLHIDQDPWWRWKCREYIYVRIAAWQKLEGHLLLSTTNIYVARDHLYVIFKCIDSTYHFQ